MSDCLFCRIVEGEIPSKRIYEDETAVAFLDINPWQQGHALVIPRRHVKDVLEDPAALAEIAPAIGTVHVLPRYADNPGISNMRGPVTTDLDQVHARLVGGE